MYIGIILITAFYVNGTQRQVINENLVFRSDVVDLSYIIK